MQSADRQTDGHTDERAQSSAYERMSVDEQLQCITVNVNVQQCLYNSGCCCWTARPGTAPCVVDDS